MRENQNLPAAERDYFFDNAKFILIILVVWGHLLELYIDDNRLIKSVYFGIYLIHMPAFVFIAGYFSKKYSIKAEWLKLFKALLWPLVAFQFLFAFFQFAYIGEVTVSPIRPYWVLWFLLSLFVWRAVLPIAVKIRYPVITFFLLSIFSGYAGFVGYEFGLSRTVYFFPFFLMGFFVDKGLIRRFTSRIKPFRFVLAPVLIGFAAIVSDWVDYRWLYGSFSYEALGFGGADAGIYRIMLYAFSVLAGLAFLAMLPDKRTFFSGLGKETLGIFLWHGFFVLWIKHSGFGQSMGTGGIIVSTMLAALLIIMSICLARRAYHSLISNMFPLKKSFLTSLQPSPSTKEKG
jgi:fucose 4-O-acetylase-like acetyltransferase